MATKKSQNRKAAETIINKCIELYLDSANMGKEVKDATKKSMDDLEKQLDNKLPLVVIHVCPDNNLVQTMDEEAIQGYEKEKGIQPDYEVDVNGTTIARIYKD